MNTIIRKTAASLMGVFSVLLISVILYLLLNIIDLRMLKAGYLEGAGTSQFIRVFFGIILLILLGSAWIGFILFVFHYYFKSLEKRKLLEKFLQLTSIELLLIPVIVITYVIAFSTKPGVYEISIFVIGLMMSVITHLLYRSRRTN